MLTVFATEPSLARQEPRLPLLMLPGTLCDERLFAPLLARLNGRPAAVADMGGAKSAPALARLILQSAPPRFALLGFSLGGIVALEMAAQAPDRVAGLALLATTPRPDPPENAALRRQAVADAQTNGVDGFIADAWDRLVSPANRDDRPLRATILAMARDGGTGLLAEQAEVAINRADSRPRLARIGVPTLVLAGEHEQVTPIGQQREVAGGVLGAEMAMIPQAGHFSPLENPDAVAHHVARWLRRLDALQPAKEIS